MLADTLPTIPLWPGAEPKVESRLTGRTDLIQNVATEEREAIISWELASDRLPRSARTDSYSPYFSFARAASSPLFPRGVK